MSNATKPTSKARKSNKKQATPTKPTKPTEAQASMWYYRKRTGECTKMTPAEAIDGQFCPKCGGDCCEYTPRQWETLKRLKKCRQCTGNAPQALVRQRKHVHFSALCELLHKRKVATEKAAAGAETVDVKNEVAEIQTNLYGGNHE